MKKLFLLMALLTTAILSRAQYEVDGLYYKISGGNAELVATQGNPYSGDIVIPENIEYEGNTYPVVSIYYAFKNNVTVSSLTIPPTVIQITDEFDSCALLNAVYISDLVAWCNINFYYYESNPLRVAHNLYLNGELLVDLVVPSGISKLKCTFIGATCILTLTLPDDPMSITGAFSECTSLKKIFVSDIKAWWVKSFGSKNPLDYAHNLYVGGQLLEHLEIPDGYASIPEYQFTGATCLKSVKVPESVTKIWNSAFSSCINLQEINIPNSVTEIGDYAFRYCYTLKSIKIPDSVISLGEGVFYNCISLEDAYIGNSVPELKSYLFYNCSSLKSVYIGKSVTKIESSYFGEVFEDCEALEKVNISDLKAWCAINFTGDGIDNPFKYSKTLYINDELVTELVIPEGTPSISAGAFRNLSSIKTATIPASVKYIGNCAFTDGGPYPLIFKANSPTSITEKSFNSQQVMIVPEDAYDSYVAEWPDFKMQIVKEGFTDFTVDATALPDESAVLKAVIGDNPESMAYNVVNLKVRGSINSYDVMVMRNKMINLHNIDLSEADILASSYEYTPGNCTSDYTVSKSMFQNMEKLITVKIPKSTLYIDRSAFYRCLNLIEMELPENLEYIGEDAFCGCSSLPSIKFPKNLTYLGDDAFRSCKKLKTVDFNQALETIGSGAFEGCTAIESIILPTNLTTIGGGAFQGCTNLREVTFPPHLEIIGGSAFASCYALEEIQLPTSLKEIKSSAFSNCTSLQEVKIPSSINKIGNGAFGYCDNLRSIYTWTIAPTNITQTTFSNSAFENATLYVPESSQKLYYYNTQWSQFLYINTFNEPYEYFYLDQKDLRIDAQTVRIEGENGNKPDADFSLNAGLIIEGATPQELGEVSVDNTVSMIASESDNPNITIERLVLQLNIQRNRWYFFCFPFNVPKNNIHFNGQFVWCYYDGEYRAENGSGAWRDAEGDLEAFKGYIFQGSKDGTLSISAENITIGTDDQMIALESYPSASVEDASWNLVGNPFTSYYNLADLGYTAPITFWNPNTRTYEAYNPEDDDILLHPYQAFFVQKPADEDGVGFESDMQETYLQSQDPANQQAAQRRRMARARTSVERFVCNIELSDGNLSDRTRVVFNEQSQMAYEIGSDAAKFISDEASQIYSLDNTNVRYSINERPMAEGVVRLGFIARNSGSYTISASRLDTPLYLIDLETGESTDLAVDSYQFDAAAGINNDRLVLSTEPSLTAIRDINADSENNATYYDLRGINHGHDMPAGISIRHDGVKTANRR